jgi:hypothetical protein
MKEPYEPIETEILLFEASDIVTLSGDTPLPETEE